MKCVNPNCGGEWTPPPGKSVTVCPFCQEPIASEKKPTQSLDNIADTLIYIKEQLGVETLLGEKSYTYFADLTHNQFRDEADLIKQLCDKGALDCLKAAIGKPESEHETALKRALSKLPKYLQDSSAVSDMLHDFASVLGWTIMRQTIAPQSIQNLVITQGGVSSNTGIIVAPPVGSVINLSGIYWRVLAIENDKALLISEEILVLRQYNDEQKDITWENSSLRKYLNGEFFSQLGAMKPKIVETRNRNPNNPWYGTTGGNATTDKVFLLSLDELIEYFGDSGKLRNQPKDDRKYRWRKGKKVYWINDQYNSIRTANFESEGASWWWLRSPGVYSGYATSVDFGGSVDVHGLLVIYGGCGVRPALWLNL